MGTIDPVHSQNVHLLIRENLERKFRMNGV